MIKQNKTTLRFILGGALLLTFAVAGCNNNSETKEVTKDSTVTFSPPTIVKDSADTMEVIPGKVAPGNDVKPQ